MNAVSQYTRKMDVIAVLNPDCPNDGRHCEAAEVWLEPQASLPHVQPMVEHMVPYSSTDLIGDLNSPSSFSGSSL